jgi:glutamate-1-semialdehyde aminotransferase
LEGAFHSGVDQIIKTGDLGMIVPHHGARFNILLGRKTPALRYEDTFCHDKGLMLKIIKGCYDRGVYFHDYGGGPAHHGFSVQHTVQDIARVLDVLAEVLGKLKARLR